MPGSRRFQVELLKNYLLAGYIVGRAGSAEQRLEFDRKALALGEQLSRQYPGDAECQTAYSRALESHAYTLTIYDLWEESRKNLRQALDIRLALVNHNGNDPSLRRDLARIQYKLGSSYADAGQSTDALPYLQKAVAIQESLLAGDPDDQNLRSDIAATHHFIGVALNKAGNWEEALLHLDDAIRIRTAALGSDARDARSRLMLAGNYAERSIAQLYLNQKKAALGSIHAAVTLQQGLIDLDGNNIPARISMADFCSRYGRIHAASARDIRVPASERRKHWREAASWYGESVKLYDRLRAEGHLLSPSIARDAERAKQEGEDAAKRADVTSE